MALETASYVANLVVSNPDGGDPRNTADDHIRLLKAVLVRTFPKVDAAVSLSATQFAFLGDVSASVQFQFNALRDGPATANYALYANSASYAAKAGRAESASYAALAGRAESASYAALAGTATLALTANSASYAALAGAAATATNAINAASANNAANAAFAVNAGTAANANALGNATPSTVAEANSIAQRNSAGQLFATYYHTDAPNNEEDAVSQIVYTIGDGYFRTGSAAYVGQFLSTRNVTDKTGTAKTLSSSGPSGGGNGDIWYVY